jgi:gliding motility-associated-like protein
MKKFISIIISGFISTLTIAQNCEINVSSSEYDISCGDCVILTAFGQNTALSVLNEDFNTGGFGAGWSGTPGAVNFSNPCSTNGVDNTPHAWMDNNTDVPRQLVSATYDFSTATAGVSICFDMLYATQGNSAPCEGPDEPDEGVYLEYSTDGGTTWTTINYFDPLGGNNAQLTSWNNYCFDLPVAALTANTQIRWFQDVGSGQDYDHWGIDNLQIFMNDITSEVVWIADAANNFPAYSYGVGIGGGDNPTPVCPAVTTTYTAQILTGTGDVCIQSVTINVVSPVINSTISASTLSICTSNNECSDITVTAEVLVDPGGPITYENIQPVNYGNGLFGSGNETVNINVQDLNMQTVSTNSIQSICIDYLTFEPSSGLQDGVTDLEISIQCPGGTEIILVPDSYAPEGINGGWFGTDQPSYYQNVCFVPAAAQNVSNIPDGSTAALPITGTYQTFTSFNDLSGCISNGVWELHLDNDNFWGGDGTLTGWSITFDDDPLLGTPNFTWNLPANLSDANSLTPTTCIPGTYVIDIDNGNPNCGATQETITISETTAGDPSFTLTDYCVGTTNQATITGDTGGTFTFNPIPTDVATLNTTTGEITDGVTGTTYTIEYTTSGTCTDASTQTVTVLNGNPSFTTTDFCESGTNFATITGETGGTFSFNPLPIDGATINGTTGEITDGLGGTDYTLEYTTSGACITSATETVTVNLNDDASFTTTDYCIGATNNATITGISGGGFTFTSLPIDGATLNNSTGEITSGMASTSYSLEYTTTGICPSTTTESVFVNPLPTIDAGVDQTVCNGENVILTANNINSATLSWDNSITDAVTFTPILGTTNYTVTATLLGCISTDNVDVIVNPIPTFTIASTNPTTCNGTEGTITISGLDANTAYDVTYLDVITQGPNTLNSDASGDIILSNLNAGAYTNFAVSLLGCFPIDNSIANLADPTAPIINAGVDQTICEPNQVTLTANNPDAANITWSNALGNPILNGTAFTPTVGTLTYTVTAELANCFSADIVDVTVNPLPTINAGLNLTICEGEAITLTGINPDNATLVWDNDVLNNTSFTPSEGLINYNITAILLGCISTDDVSVLVHPLPDVNFSANPQGCVPLDVTFTNLNTTSVNCLWNYGNGNTSSFCGNTTTTYTEPGLFSVTLTITDFNNCTNTLTETDYITVEAMPEAIFNVESNFVDIEDIDMAFDNNSLNSTNYEWSFGDETATDYSESPFHSFPAIANSDYSVILTASNDIGCIHTDTTIIHINDVLIYFVPNAFTPDGDEFNQIFKPVFTSGFDIYDYHFMVFNRWGEMVFESYDAEYGWNGRYGRSDLKQDGVYTWEIIFKESVSDERHQELGHVLLIK